MQDFKTHILPAAQLKLWNRMNDLPSAFTLYGGTAVALRLGHRESVDFDFFSEEKLDEASKRALLMTLPWLAGAEILQNRDQTLTVSIDVESNPVKVSFFGGMSIGRVGEPDKCVTNGVCIAALSDLLACKLKCLHDRAEGKDYQDIAVMLENGVGLAQGLADRAAMFGQSVPAMETVKALVWFDDINEPWRLTAEARVLIKEAVAQLPAVIPIAYIKSASLSCDKAGLAHKVK